MCAPNNRKENKDKAKKDNKPVQKEQKQPCEDVKPKLEFVEFIDGDDNTILAGNAKQFVNLSRDKKWVDSKRVTSIDRLGAKTGIKVKFDKRGAHKFSIKYILTPGAAYSEPEKTRNENFKHQDKEKEYTTDGNGIKIIKDDFFINASGKNKFKVEAKDENDVKKQSKELESHRVVFYQEVKMVKKLPDSTFKRLPTAKKLTGLIDEFKKYNIHLVRASSHGSVVMDYMENIGPDDSDTFRTKVKTAYNTTDAKNKKPYAIAIAYTDHLAVKDSSRPVISPTIEVGPGKPDLVISITSNGTRKYLWKGIVTGEEWFVSASFKDDTSGDVTRISKAKCTAVPRTEDRPDRCDKVRVKVSGLAAGRGKITLRVNWVNRFRGGLSFSDCNLVCACTRTFWKDKPENKQVQTMIHEVGHKMGLVPDGTGKKTDKTATWYDSTKGHVGNHCYFGCPDGQARYDSSNDATNSRCVMYGSSNNASKFCANCGKALLKADLSGGWSDL